MGLVGIANTNIYSTETVSGMANCPNLYSLLWTIHENNSENTNSFSVDHETNIHVGK